MTGGVEGVFEVCRHLDMLDGERSASDPTVARNHLGQVSASNSGLFRPERSLELGQYISDGTAVGTLYDPASYEVLQRASADRDGVLYALRREATVTAGSRLAGVAEVIDR